MISSVKTRLFKHTTTLFSLSDHYILSREWRVIVDQVQTNYHGRHVVASELKDPICHSDECQIGSFSSEATMWSYFHSGVTELLIIRDHH